MMRRDISCSSSMRAMDVTHVWMQASQVDLFLQKLEVADSSHCTCCPTGEVHAQHTQALQRLAHKTMGASKPLRKEGALSRPDREGALVQRHAHRVLLLNRPVKDALHGPVRAHGLLLRHPPSSVLSVDTRIHVHVQEQPHRSDCSETQCIKLTSNHLAI